MNDRIAKRKQTKKRRKSLTCKVRQTKVDNSHLSKADEIYFTLFGEAKWFRNYCLSLENIADADTTIKSVPVKVKDVFEERKFVVLTSQMKQGIKQSIFDNLVALSRLKELGYKIGWLKYKSFCNSIPLKQYNNTYYLGNKRIRIQGLKKWLRVHGLEQIPKDAEIANATLTRKNGNYYINITTYQDIKKDVPVASIGIDFGCETQLTFSNGIKSVFQVPPSKRQRKLDRKIMKKRRKDSSNKRKDQHKRRKEYEKTTNKKKDIKNKINNAITKNFKFVCFQDESIHAWAMGNHGKKIQHSGIGGIISDLKNKSETPIMVGKFFPSTQLCPSCNKKTKHTQSQRVYICDFCKFTDDRDIKSAQCIETEGMKQVPTEYRELCESQKIGEISASAFFDTMNKIHGIKVSKPKSLSQEAAHPLG